MKKNTRELNSIRNFTVGLVNQFLMLFLGLISKNIFLKTLGTTYMGLNSLFSNILLLSFAEFGIGSVMVYSLYKPLALGEKGEIATVYNFFRKIYRSLSLAVFVIGIVIVPLLPSVVNIEENISMNSIKVYFSLYLLGVVISNAYMYKSHLILADQKNYILSLFNILFDNGATLIQIAILLKTKNYYLFIISFVVKNLLMSLAISYKVNKLYPFLKSKEIVSEVSKEERSNIYGKLIDVFGYRVARLFITGTDNVIISVLIGTIWVGYYSNYDLIVIGVTGLVSTFYDGISASVGDLIARERVEDQYGMFETVQILNIWITGFTVTCLYILFQDFITLWLGAEYVIDFKIVILIIINYYLICNRKPIIIFREAAGMFNKIKKAMFLAAVINIVVSVLLGYVMGIHGILLGTIIASLTTYFWYEPMILISDQFAVSVKPFIKLQMENIIYACLSILITSSIVMWIKEVTIVNFIIKMIICLIVPNAFYILILRRKERFKGVLEIGVRYYKKLRKRLGHG